MSMDKAAEVGKADTKKDDLALLVLAEKQIGYAAEWRAGAKDDLSYPRQRAWLAYRMLCEYLGFEPENLD
jgi:hypothetical protein